MTVIDVLAAFASERAPRTLSKPVLRQTAA